MARSTWKGPFVDGYLLKKIQKTIDSGKKDVIKTWNIEIKNIVKFPPQQQKYLKQHREKYFYKK